MKKLVIMLLLSVALVGCKRPAVIQEVEQPIVRYDNTALSMEDVERAIMLGGVDQGWNIQRVSPGHLIGSINVRGKHEAVVDIRHDTSSYSVTYKDSTNLNYTPPNQIHNNYNRWVDYLVRSINSSMQRIE